MLQYLLNLSAIWVTGLLAFDLFLARESYHRYNRLYLLLTVFAGILLPLWSWQENSIIYNTAFSGQVAVQSSELKSVIVNSSAPVIINWQQWLLIVYALGVGISVIMFIRELAILFSLFSYGSKSKHERWTIVETGKEISPFSAFRIVFINSKTGYTAEELKMILAHEEQHSNLAHFADLLFIRIATIIFWFHPLIYLFRKRLVMVHEYQADMAVRVEAADYSQFLIEQSVLNAAPALSHSFIRSPLKKRIYMLTRTSAGTAKVKQLLIAPVMLIALLCFTKNALSKGEVKREGNKIIYNGNIFETKEQSPDTMMVQNAETGEFDMLITTRSGPATIVNMNNKPVFSRLYIHNGPQPNEINSAEKQLKAEIDKVVTSELKLKQKGEYTYSIHNIIVDTKGHVVFYELEGMIARAPYPERDKILSVPADMKKRMDERIVQMLEDIQLPPLQFNDNPMPYNISIEDIFTIL